MNDNNDLARMIAQMVNSLINTGLIVFYGSFFIIFLLVFVFKVGQS